MVTILLTIFINTLFNLFIALKLIPHHKGNWSTDGIFIQSFDGQKNVIHFRTTHLGNSYFIFFCFWLMIQVIL